MLLRRFLPIICVLFTLIAINVHLNKARASSYIRGQYIQMGGLNAAHSYKASAGAQTPVCPKIPTPQKQGTALLAFCAPKYLGNVAGPYGSHIVLVGENLSQIPSTWLIVPENRPITNSQKLVSCATQSTASCLQLPVPQVSKLDQSTLFSWIWGKDIPNKVGDYNITAIIGRLQDAHPQIVSTAVSFTLLTSEAPCITLDNTNCSSTQPASVIDLSKTRTLILFGSNWALGWGANAITESIEMTASCSTPQYCANRTPLFDITIPSSQIDADGGFSREISLSTNISGTYRLTAINHVQTVITTGNTANDTVADGTLSFGNTGDINSLTIRLIPPPVPPTINAGILNMFATIVLLLASLGILYHFFIRQRQAPAVTPSYQASTAEKQQFIQAPPIQISSGTLLSSYSSPSERRVTEVTTGNASNFQHKHLLVAFPPIVAPAPKALIISSISKLIRSSTPNFNRKIQRAIQTIDSKSARSNPQQLLRQCSRALVYCALVFPRTQIDSQEYADTLFDMGFTYINLAAIAEHTVPFLLQNARRSYEAAMDIYKLGGNAEAYNTTLIALGDAWYALSEVSQANNGERAAASKKASLCYQDARPKILPHQQIDINLRIRYSNAR